MVFNSYTQLNASGVFLVLRASNQGLPHACTSIYSLPFELSPPHKQMKRGGQIQTKEKPGGI